MAVEYTVVSIGALSRNRFWNESQAKRAAHATTTFIREGNTTIVVDPGLPAELLQQRLDERTGLRPDQIDIVFLTTFRPVHRRGLAMFQKASWLMHEPEIDAIQGHLGDMTERARTQPEEIMRLVREERALIERIRPAPEKITPNVHLFPAMGVTPGLAALLLPTATRTVVVAGDAVVTRDYYQAGRVFEQASDVQAAQVAFSEIIGIADEIIPGHDNVFLAGSR